MRTSLAAAAALLMLCTGAQADNFASRFGGRNGLIADGQTTVGVGLICDTSEQALRFVALRGAGSEPEQAMQTVNSEAHKERACGVAAVAFVPDQTVQLKVIDGKLVRIMRINVVAGFNGNNWQPVQGMVQYAVIDAAGETI